MAKTIEEQELKLREASSEVSSEAGSGVETVIVRALVQAIQDKAIK